MATRKYISVEEAAKIVCNDNSGNELIPKLKSSDLSHAIICGNVHISGTPLDNVSPNYHPIPHGFIPEAISTLILYCIGLMGWSLLP